MTVLRTRSQTEHIVSGVSAGRFHRQAIVPALRAVLVLLVQMAHAYHVQVVPSLVLICLHVHRVLLGLSPMAPDVHGVHCQHSLLTLSTVLQLVTARGRRMIKVARRHAHCVGPV